MERNNVAKGTVKISFTQVLQLIIRAGFYVAVTKTGALTEADVGVISVLAFLGQAIFVFAGLSLPEALVKYVSENLEKGLAKRAASVRRTINRSVILLSTFIHGLLIALSPQISRFLWNTDSYALLIVLMCIYSYFNRLIHLYNHSLQTLRLFGKVATVTLLWVVVSRVLGVTLAFLNFGVYGVLTGYVIGYAAAFAASFFFVRGKFPSHESYVSLKPFINFSFPLFLGALLNLILNWADVIFVTSLTADYARVGIYYITVESALFLAALWLPVTYTIFPLLSGRHGLRDFHGVSRILKTTSRYWAYLLVPACVGLAALAPEGLKFFYAEEYAAGAVSLAILSFAQIFMSIYFLLITTLTAIGKTTLVFRVNVLSVVTYISFLFFLVPQLQEIGAAVARLGMVVVAFLVAAYSLGKYLRVQFDFEALWKSVVSSLAMLLILLLIRYLTAGFPAHFVILIGIAGGGCSYLSSLYILKALNSQDFELLKRTFQPLTRYINVVEGIMVRKAKGTKSDRVVTGGRQGENQS